MLQNAVSAACTPAGLWPSAMAYWSAGDKRAAHVRWRRMVTIVASLLQVPAATCRAPRPVAIIRMLQRYLTRRGVTPTMRMLAVDAVAASSPSLGGPTARAPEAARASAGSCAFTISNRTSNCIGYGQKKRGYTHSVRNGMRPLHQVAADWRPIVPRRIDGGHSDGIPPRLALTLSGIFAISARSTRSILS
jgi:hypothetical protein